MAYQNSQKIEYNSNPKELLWYLELCKTFIFVPPLCLIYLDMSVILPPGATKSRLFVVMSGNLTPGATKSRLFVLEALKLHVVAARWRNSTMVDRHIEKVRCALLLPLGHNGVLYYLVWRLKSMIYIPVYRSLVLFELWSVNMRCQHRNCGSSMSTCATISDKGA